MSDPTQQPAGPNEVMTSAIDRVALGQDLSADDAAAVLDQIMSGAASDSETAGFLIGLRTKGETADELAGLARAMRSHATPVECGRDDLVDTAGTGGGAPTFNVSTTAAFVACGAGCAIAKHGNRSNTSRSGSADLLEALGAQIELSPQAVATLIDEIGFGFMFAPVYHRAMKYVVPVRKALAVRTAFNFLGPLTNPAGASHQLIGVSDIDFQDTMAHALAELGTAHSMVVHGMERIDELSAVGASRVTEVRGNEVTTHDVTPEELGLSSVEAGTFSAGTPEDNAATTKRILSGGDGSDRTITVINAAAAIFVSGKAASLAEGVQLAQQSIDSGAAHDKLDAFIERSRELGS
ncbi:MAG TPA: anthranilate phosphoribosyltransferase [Solirubrobacterales bacterium]|jgi:anthranilate phosphoribosyltransferase|nr:anthranilate phosphoribosyltransferase [Solirubrobacterales bacterium]